VALSGVVGTAVRRARGEIWLERGVPNAALAPARRYPSGRAQPGACPELDCVRHLLPQRIVAAAERRALSIGTGAERVLICADAVTEEAYLAALANSLGTSYERLDGVTRADCPLDDGRLIEAAAAGLLPLRQGNRLIWIIAPRGLTARRLADPRQPKPPWLGAFRLTSADRLRHFVERHGRTALGKRATESLHRGQPLFSNAPRAPARRGIRAIALVLLAFTILAVLPLAAIEALSGLLCVMFLAASILRVLTACFGDEGAPREFRIADSALPVYTVICALYREAAVVGNLVAALRALDYPPEKLDVKFVLEADDRETQAALGRLNLGPPFEIIIAPPIGPRTKPKALNIALPLARGAYTVIYDAEDKPEPDQLRRAIAAFRHGGHGLACVQASLTIDNSADNWLTRMFTANYAGQFDAFLPGLAALRLPFPLGGSSNHFRTALLRKAGGWDPYNVTEDADLGIRLCRLGYRSRSLPSATYEEAPARFVTWLHQRTRWYKGWMQTWLVHMRRPGRLWRDLGPAGTVVFQILFAANVLAALIHPLFMTGLGFMFYALPTQWGAAVMASAAPIFATCLISGYASTVVLDVIGLKRRGLLGHAWVLVLTPLHWLLLSFAAWRALFQLLYAPQRWEKTEHGLARTSRVASSKRSRLERRRNRIDIGPLNVPRRVRIEAPAPIAPLQLMQSALPA
jgi:cellulose synthase/poly-beta-1,6-N-acetylglucosamine synthase-like glycosyltransferase